MSYHRTKKLSSSEKKLEILKTQLYGNVETNHSKIHATVPTSTSSVNQTDVSFLKKDLLKSLFLAGSAIALQLFLYVGIQHGLIKF